MVAPHAVETGPDDTEALARALREAASLAARGRHVRALATIDAALRTRPQDAAQLAVQLLALRTAVMKQRRLFVNRMVLLALLIASAATIGFLQFTHVPSVDIVVDLRTRGVFLTLAESASLHAAPVTAVLISSPTELSAYALSVQVLLGSTTRVTSPARRLTPDPLFPLSIRPSDASAPQMVVSGDGLAVSRFDVTAGVPLEIRPDGGSQPTVTIRHGAPTNAILGTGDALTVECRSCDVIQEDHVLAQGGRLSLSADPRELQLKGTGDRTDVGLLLAGSGASGGADRRVRLASIDFTSNVGTLESLIQEATVRIVDLGDKPIALTDRDFLEIDGFDDLVASRLVLGPTILMRLEGRVRRLSTGAGRTMHSRMPTRLEWSRANRPVSLFVAVFALFGFLVANAMRIGIIRSD